MDLIVRPWREDDAAALNRAVQESLEHLRPWMPWAAAPPPDDAQRRAWIAEQNAAEAAGGDRLRGFLVDGAIVGAGGLHRRIGPGGLEVGYWVHVGWTRRGIATAAARALCAEAFADPAIDHVEIHHDVANVASGRVAEALGFTLVSEAPSERRAPGESGVERIWRRDAKMPDVTQRSSSRAHPGEAA